MALLLEKLERFYNPVSVHSGFSLSPVGRHDLPHEQKPKPCHSSQENNSAW
jgi:hypothetical protein